MRRSDQLYDLADTFQANLKVERIQAALNNPEGRQDKIDSEILRLESFLIRSANLRGLLAQYVKDLEIGVSAFERFDFPSISTIFPPDVRVSVTVNPLTN